MNKFAILTIIGLVFVPAAHAQEARGVTLAEVLEAAVGRHPSLRIAEARRDAAAGRVSELRSGYFPQLKLTGRAAYLSDVPEFSIPFISEPLFPSIRNNYGARLSLQQNLFTGYRLGGSVDMAEANALAQQYDYERDQSDFTLGVVMAYWGLYRAERVVEVLNQSVDQVSAHVADIRRFRQQGLATEADVLKVETQLSEINVKAIQARGNLKIAQMNLNSLMGHPLEDPVRAVDHPFADSVRAAAMDLGVIIRTARSRRPEVAAMEQRKVMQSAALTAANAGWYPFVVLSANLDHARPNQRIIPPKDQWETTWDIGLQFQWNIWDWFATSAQADQARAQLMQAEAALDQVNDAVALEAAQSYFTLQEATERIGAAELGRKQATESHRVMSERFAQGLASSTDLLDAETALLQARLTETQAVSEYAIQRERYRKSLGGLRD
ncbi:MAG: TolC family protein [Bacteroidota bacterium]